VIDDAVTVEKGCGSLQIGRVARHGRLVLIASSTRKH
jgi:hypothetical protein